MLDGVVAHEVTELGSFLEHFRRKALKRAVVGSLAKPLQFHELAHVHKLAEENDIRTLIFRVHDILDNDDSQEPSDITAKMPKITSVATSDCVNIWSKGTELFKITSRKPEKDSYLVVWQQYRKSREAKDKNQKKKCNIFVSRYTYVYKSSSVCKLLG